MKKIQLLITAVASAIAMHAGAQGTINFGNNSTSYVVTNTIPFGSSGRASAATGTRVQLYYGTVGSTEAQLVAVGTPVSMGLAGVFSGGSLTLPGIPEGASAVFEVRGWTGGYASYDAAAASFDALLGISSMWTQVTGAPNAIPPTTVGMVNGPGGFTGLILTAPEPSTYALMGLGLLGLAFKPARKLFSR